MKPSFFGKLATPAIAAAISLAAAFGARAQTLGASNFNELVNAVESYKTAAADVVIVVTGSIAVNSTIFVNGNAGGKTLTIKGNSPFNVPALTRDAGFGSVMLAVFDPLGGADLILENVVIDGLGLSAAGPLVSVMRGCSFTMGAGAVLKGNAAAGGVSVSEGGLFTMNGGEISGNTAGSAPYGGGVSVSGGSFVMSGGRIVNNAVNSADYGAYGGGVSISGGTFTMKGGEIGGNAVNSGLGGGGVYAHNCEFTMTGGAISGNSASAASGNGGGVYLIGGSFTMTGGEAGGNTAGANGGGVYVHQAAGAFTLGGTAKITGNGNSAGAASNVYLSGGKYIALQTPRTGLSAGVYTATASGVIVQNGAGDGDENRLFADQNDKRVTRSGSQLAVSDDDRPSLAGDAVTVTQANTPLTYTGSPLTPKFNVAYAGKTLVEGVDYRLETAPQTGVGQYNTAVIRATGTGPCKGERSGVTWIIGKATPKIISLPSPNPQSIPYGTPLLNVALTGGSADVSGAFEWINGATKPDVASSGPFGVRFTPADITNYNSATLSVTVTVTRAAGDFGSHPAVSVAYKQGLTLAGIPLNAGYKWKNANTQVFAGGSRDFDAAYTDPGGNYNPVDGTVQVTVHEAVIDTRAILGVIPPATGGKAVATIPETVRYTGTVGWYPHDAYFNPGTKYIATITLEPKPNYTFVGVPANFFTVAGASGVSNYAHSGTVIAEFPVTGPQSTITIAGPQALTVVRRGGAATLSVSAGVSPSAVLSYQWYKCAYVDKYAAQLIPGATGASFTVPETQPGPYYYYCDVTAATGGVVTATASSTVATVEIRDIPSAADLDYVITPVIPYDGSPHPVTVKPHSWVADKLGAITAVKYNGGADVPVNAGTYAVTAEIAEGTVYDAETVSLGSYTISRAQITVDPAGSAVAPKQYDGTTAAEVTSVAFGGGVYHTFVMGDDYAVSGAAFDAAGAGSRTVTAFVALADNAKTVNYALAGGNFLKSGVVISKRAPVADDFVMGFPEGGNAENGKPQPIDDLIYARPALSGMGAVTVLYDGLPASASYPVGAKAYAVSVNVAEGPNFNAVSGLALGVYRIWSDNESISGAAVRVLREYVYGGSPRVPAADEISVTLYGVALRYGVDFTVTASNNVNAGKGSVTVAGKGRFTGSASGEFTIAKKKPALSDLSPNLKTVTYNAAAQPAAVTAAAGVAGLGAITTSYTGAGAEPVDAGVYEVFVSVAEGSNYEALPPVKLNGTYTIQKKSPNRNDLVFSIPTNHYYTGQPQGIGPVTLKGTGYGTVTLLYNGSPDLPVEAGTYAMYLEVSGGENYLPAAGAFDNYVIAAERGAVRQPERALPGGGSDVAVAAALVCPPAAEFTAGPNPVAGPRGAVKFFRRGARAADGELAVYDVSGNVVNRVSIRDKLAAGDNANNYGHRREVGSWNLRDGNGRPVAGGTYLVRGVISAVNGERERVSVIIGVR
jgi:hypothetical protein